MTDTFTATLDLTKPEIDGSSDTWGVKLNENMDKIDTELSRIDSAIVPVGGIIMWSGTVASIPTNWRLCDGLNGTPNLRNRFIVGAGQTYSPGDTGGAATVALATANLPAHTHSFSATTGSDGSHTHPASTNTTGNHNHTHSRYASASGVTAGNNFNALTGTTTANTGSDGSHSHTVSVNSAGAHTHSVSGTTGSMGSGTAHENLPPYYALAFIMRVE